MITLTMRPIAFSGEGQKLTYDHPFQYEVMGMPTGQKAMIADLNHRWRIMRIFDDVSGDWRDEHATAEEALAALQAELVTKCHFCGASIEGNNVMWFLPFGGGAKVDGNVLQTFSAAYRERVEGAVPTCPKCLEGLKQQGER